MRLPNISTTAQDFTIGQSSYEPVPQSEYAVSDQLYIQPQLTAALLSRAAHSNEKVLSSLKVSRELEIDGEPIKGGMSLRELALMGADNDTNAWAVWQAFWRELTQPAEDPLTKRPPVLIAIDGLDHWMGLSKYRSTEYELIHAHQMTLVKQFLSILFAQNTNINHLANGGMIVAATSGSNSPSFPDFNLLLRQIKASFSGLQITDQAFPMPEPYRKKPDQRVLDLLGSSKDTTLQTLQGLSRDESRGLLEYYARSGVLREGITEANVGTMRTLSGGGVIGEMAKLGKRIRV